MEDLSAAQMEQNNLTKMLIDNLQGKVSELEHLQARSAGNSGATRQELELVRAQNTTYVNTQIERIQSKIESQMSTMPSFDNDWSQKERKILEVIDQQGKDVATDFSRLEDQFNELHRQFDQIPGLQTSPDKLN